MSRTLVHLHLPRLRAWRAGAGGPDVLSVKVPGRKIDYVDEIYLRDVEFRVHERGRQRTLATGQRNVHAWAVGEPFVPLRPLPGLRRAVYDPHRAPTFVDYETHAPVLHAHAAHLIGDKLYYQPLGE